MSRLKFYTATILTRDNVGYDFSAWRDAIRHFGWSRTLSYDEVIFANNSCYGPVFPFEEMFAEMERKSCDFWGVTAFPELKNSSRPEAGLLPDRNIHAHVQSYFMVIRHELLNSVQFFHFWEKIENQIGFMEVVTQYEIGFTKEMVESGFSWDVYLPVSKTMQLENSWNPRFNLAYNKPYDLLLMRNPLVKKRAWDYSCAEMDKSVELIESMDSIPPHLLVR